MSHLMRHAIQTAVLFLCLGVSTLAEAGEAEAESLALAALLVRDGQWDRAESVIASIPTDSEEANTALYFTTVGLLAMQKQQFESAAVAYESALKRAKEEEEAPESSLLQLYLAQAWFAADEPIQALKALDAAEDREKSTASGWIMRIQVERAAGLAEQAWASAQSAEITFPADLDIGSLQVDILAAHGLFEPARDQCLSLIEHPHLTADHAVQLVGILREHRALEAAAIVADLSRLRFPTSLNAWLSAAQVAMERGANAEAAHYLQIASTIDPSYGIQAAEAWRQAGMAERALYMNAQSGDSPEKARQRLALLLEAEEYARALSLEPRLSRHQLLSEDPIRYGLAYAHFQLGQIDESETWLNGISDPQIFRQATRLRSAIAAHRSDSEDG
jgi:tetratricopeptide (TPR) repeat protein